MFSLNSRVHVPCKEEQREDDCSDERLSLTSCESGIHPNFARPLNSPPLPSPERCDLIRAFRSRGRAPRALRAAEASSVIICNRCTVPVPYCCRRVINVQRVICITRIYTEEISLGFTGKSGRERERAQLILLNTEISSCTYTSTRTL